MIYLVQTLPGIHTVMTLEEIQREETIGHCPDIVGEVVDCTQKDASAVAVMFEEGKLLMLTLKQAYGDLSTGQFGFFFWMKQYKKRDTAHKGKGYKDNVIIWKTKQENQDDKRE